LAIDIVFIILMLFAVFKGLQRGLIVAIFSVLACIIGLAAAIKLSALVAAYLQSGAHLHSKWLPILSFIIVFACVVLLVRWLANLLQKAIDFVFLEWLNKLGGVILYVALFLAVYSVILFYGAKSNIISRHAIAASRSYAFVEPWGPYAINGVGKIIPFFRDMFTTLEDFFAGIARKAS